MELPNDIEGRQRIDAFSGSFYESIADDADELRAYSRLLLIARQPQRKYNGARHAFFFYASGRTTPLDDATASFYKLADASDFVSFSRSSLRDTGAEEHTAMIFRIAACRCYMPNSRALMLLPTCRQDDDVERRRWRKTPAFTFGCLQIYRISCQAFLALPAAFAIMLDGYINKQARLIRSACSSVHTRA